MRVGDKVHLVNLPSWGVCEIITVHQRNEDVRYSVKWLASTGITFLCHLRPDDLRPAGSPTAGDEK